MAVGPVNASFLSHVPSTSVRSRPANEPPVADRVEIRGAPPEPATYGALRTSAPAQRKPDLDSILEETKQKVEQFVRMLGGMVKEQGLEWSKVVRGEQHLTVDPATQRAAAEAIGPDGEFGVEQTAGRILDFAKAMIGGDPEKLAAIRDALEQGFAEAEEAFGGTLPDISYQTMAAVRSELDRWAKEGLP